MSFEAAFADLAALEGGYSADDRDPGNWTGGACGRGELRGTNCGISAAAYPKLDIANLQLSQIKDLYLVDYWDKIRGDTLPDVVATALFKEAVNLGVSGAVKALQRSLRLEPDGIMGQITQGHATAQPPAIVINDFLTECAMEYVGMSNFKQDGRGWISRVIKTALEAKL